MRGCEGGQKSVPRGMGAAGTAEGLWAGETITWATATARPRLLPVADLVVVARPGLYLFGTCLHRLVVAYGVVVASLCASSTNRTLPCPLHGNVCYQCLS